MKRLLVTFLTIAALGRLASPAFADNDSAKVADKEYADERYKQVNADIQSLQAAIEAHQRAQETLLKRIDALANEIRSLRDENAHSGTTFVTRDELKEVVKDVQLIDRKREDDKKLILEEIAKMGKTLAAPAPTPRKPEPAPAATAQEGEFAEYTVLGGDSLSAIVSAFNKKFVSEGRKRVSLKQVEEANPKVKAGVINPGQKLMIPIPPKAP